MTDIIDIKWSNRRAATSRRTTNFGETLGTLIGDIQETKGITNAAIASAAGISESTVQQIKGGSIECPPTSRLEGIASALSVPVSQLITAANSDGCDYGS